MPSLPLAVSDLDQIPEWFFEVYSDEAVDLRAEQAWDIKRPVAIKAAITGAFFTRASNPTQPYLPEEIAQEAIESAEAGACAVHIHVRNAAGIPVGKLDYYRQTIGTIRDRLNESVVIDGCTVFKTIHKAKEVIDEELFETSPVNTTACFIGNSILALPPAYQQAHARLLQEVGIKPQIAVYTNGDVDTARRYLIEPGLVEPPFYWIVVPAMPGCVPAPNPSSMVENLTPLLRHIREVTPESVIEVCAAGRAASYTAALALVLGVECIRVGKEDTIYRWPHRPDLVEQNAQAVRDARAMAEAMGRTVATANDLRDWIQVPAR